MSENPQNNEVVEVQDDVELPAVVAEGDEQDLAVSYADLLEGRAAFYEMLASLFFMPLKQDQIDEMAEQDFSAYEDINDEFSAGLNDIRRYLRKRNTGSRQELACDFTSAFAGTKTYNGLAAVPYESVFTSEDGLLCRESYHEVYAAYKHEALRKRDDLNFPEDHLSFLCQFMALMSRRASQHIADDDFEAALKDLRSSGDFLQHHILSWYAAFRERAMLLVQTRFYRGVLALGAGYFAFDAEVLADLAAEVEACL